MRLCARRVRSRRVTLTLRFRLSSFERGSVRRRRVGRSAATTISLAPSTGPTSSLQPRASSLRGGAQLARR